MEWGCSRGKGGGKETSLPEKVRYYLYPVSKTLSHQHTWHLLSELHFCFCAMVLFSDPAGVLTRISSQGYDNSESSVRKACVFCLVAVHAVIGDELKPHLSQLTGSKVSRAALSQRWWPWVVLQNRLLCVYWRVICYLTFNKALSVQPNSSYRLQISYLYFHFCHSSEVRGLVGWLVDCCEKMSTASGCSWSPTHSSHSHTQFLPLWLFKNKQKREKRINSSWKFPGYPMVKVLCFHCRGKQVLSLVGGLRSYMPHSIAEKKERKNKLWLYIHGLTCTKLWNTRTFRKFSPVNYDNQIFVLILFLLLLWSQ